MRRSIVLLLLCLSLGIQAQQWRFWVDELHPAQRTMLQDAKSVMVVNNSVVQPADFGHSVSMDGTAVRHEVVDLSNAALHCLFSATQTLENSENLLQVELLESTQNTSNNFYTRKLLTASQMQAICQEYEADALLIINQLVLYNIQESFPLEDGTYYAYTQAYAQAHWSIYHQGKVQSFATSDTLVWESNPTYTRSRALEQLPSTQEALLYLATCVGDSAARSLTPQWVSTPRYLYDNPNPHIQAGLQALQYQRWEEAIQHWSLAMEEKQRKNNDKKTAAYAAANIAIAYEMMGDYASACDYAQHAIRLFGAWKTAYGRQQQVNMRYYLAQVQAKKAN